MATVNDWNKYINLAHELALIEDELHTRSVEGSPGVRAYAMELLWEHF